MPPKVCVLSEVPSASVAGKGRSHYVLRVGQKVGGGGLKHPSDTLKHKDRPQLQSQVTKSSREDSSDFYLSDSSPLVSILPFY